MISTTKQTYATFRDMGLHAEKRVAQHILLENTYENNLVSDISQVDYTKGNLGPTNLQPLDGLPMFVDDIYVYGYLSREEIVYRGNRVSLSTGEKGQAKKVVAAVQTCIGATFGVEEKPIHVSIVQTVRYRGTGAICKTIDRIERDTENETIDQWKHLRGEDPDACVVAKIDVSEINIDKLHQHIEQFQKYLFACGYGLYCIDYTQDFSGTLDRKKLVEHLVHNCGMREQGDLCNAMDQDAPTILANTESVGNNVCTWVQTNAYGKTVRAKLYNKIVSNFEAGEVREPFGGHLADYANCSNEHLRKTFLHPDVQARGCTRVEVSLYACRIGEDISQGFGKDTIFEAVGQVEGDLFVVQPAKKQWENLAKEIDRCTILADRPNKIIYACWFAHTKTGRMVGVQISPTQEVCENNTKWEKATQWTMSEFGFRKCPIFRIDILEANLDGIDVAPLRCYVKPADSKTVLARSKYPTQVCTGEDPTLLLPSTEYIAWEWRSKKTKNAIGLEKQRFLLEEIPTNRYISMLSTRRRTEVLERILEDGIIETWKKEKKEFAQITKEQRDKELQCIEAVLEEKKKHEQEAREIYNIVQHAFVATTKIEGISTLPIGQTACILGFRYIQTRFGESAKIVLRWQNNVGVFWATKPVYKAISIVESTFRSEKQGNTTTFYIPSEAQKLAFQTKEPESFFSSDGKKITYIPVVFVETPSIEKQKEIEEILAIEPEEQPPQYLQQIQVPKPKDTKKTIDMEEGEYICYRFAKTMYRGKSKTILFLSRMDAGGNAIGEEMPTYGPFLEDEVAKMDLPACTAPMYCRIGGLRHTKARNKERTVSCVFAKESFLDPNKIEEPKPTKKECRAYKKRNKERVQIALQYNANNLAIVPEKTKEIQVLGFRILHTVQGKLAIFVARYKKIYEEGQINYCIDCDDVHSKDEDWCKPNHACENPFFAVQPFWGNQQILEYLESIVQNNFCLHYTKQGEKIFFFPSSNACPVFALSEIKTFSKDGETIACREVIGCKEDWVSKYQEIAHILG